MTSLPSMSVLRVARAGNKNSETTSEMQTAVVVEAREGIDGFD
jgi:hypothetical protein